MFFFSCEFLFFLLGYWFIYVSFQLKKIPWLECDHPLVNRVRSQGIRDMKGQERRRWWLNCICFTNKNWYFKIWKKFFFMSFNLSNFAVTFFASRIGTNLLMFHVYFLKNIARPKGVTLEVYLRYFFFFLSWNRFWKEIASMYDERLGRPSADVSFLSSLFLLSFSSFTFFSLSLFDFLFDNPSTWPSGHMRLWASCSHKSLPFCIPSPQKNKYSLFLSFLFVL